MVEVPRLGGVAKGAVRVRDRGHRLGCQGLIADGLARAHRVEQGEQRRLRVTRGQCEVALLKAHPHEVAGLPALLLGELSGAAHRGTSLLERALAAPHPGKPDSHVELEPRVIGVTATGDQVREPGQTPGDVAGRGLEVAELIVGQAGVLQADSRPWPGGQPLA